jgi:hypothetical protein
MDEVVDAIAELVSAFGSASEEDVHSVEIGNWHGALEQQPDVVILRVKLAVNHNAVAVCDRRDKKRSRGDRIARSHGNDGELVLSSRVDMLHGRDNNQYDRSMTEIRIIPSGPH